MTGHKPMNLVISYSRTDTDFVDKLVADLTTLDFAVWVDRRNLEAGQIWDARIREAIVACYVMLVVVSPDALESKYVRKEYLFALKHHKAVIPLRYFPTRFLPSELARLQWVNFRAGINFERAYPVNLDDLARAI